MRGWRAKCLLIIGACIAGGALAAPFPIERPQVAATDVAVKRVRGNEQRARELLRNVVSAPDSPRGHALLVATRKALTRGPDLITFDRAILGDGTVVVRTAFHGRGESGGG